MPAVDVTESPGSRDAESPWRDGFLDAARPYWHPVARSKDLAPGTVVPVTLLGEDLVLWRALDNSLGLLDDLCAHRGTRLSRGDVGRDGCIRCPYHAWEYAADGACTRLPQLPGSSAPAKARVRAYEVTEQAGLVWACLVPAAERLRGIPPLPEADDPAMHVYAGEPIDWACQSGRQIENFCDIAHFSVVHVGVFGNPDVAEVPPHRVERSADGWQLRTAITYPAVNTLEAPGPDGKHPVVPIDFDYTVELPFAVRLRSSAAGRPYVLLCANQPVTSETCRVFWVMVMDAQHAIADDLLEAMEQSVFLADREVVETQRPSRLPIDLGAELHLPFDRMAAAYRRALVELGFPGSDR